MASSSAPRRIGDRSTSDVIVRIRTHQGRDDWFYCHSSILVEKSKYFADRLSDDWPTCQIIGSRNCVDIYCEGADLDHYVNFLRILYVAIDGSSGDIWHCVRNALGILQVAVELGCPQIVTACVNYLEAVPWEEAEEEEILRIIPGMGSQAEPILARLQPVNPSTIKTVFLSAVLFATSSPPSPMNNLKTSAQEQLEYMLTEDDDAPLLSADGEIRSIVKECVKGLLSRFNDLLDTFLLETAESASGSGNMQSFHCHVSDMSWASQIVSKLEIMSEFVNSWVDASEKILQVVMLASSTGEIIETKLKIIEATSKVLEAIGCGTVILPTAKRLNMVKTWLPFVRVSKPLIDSVTTNEEEAMELKIDSEMWQSLESAFVSIVLALPSGDQAQILTEWLESEHITYPDFTEAFEIWCYRSKIARRRLANIEQNHGMTSSSTLSQ